MVNVPYLKVIKRVDPALTDIAKHDVNVAAVYAMHAALGYDFVSNGVLNLEIGEHGRVLFLTECCIVDFVVRTLEDEPVHALVVVLDVIDASSLQKRELRTARQREVAADRLFQVSECDIPDHPGALTETSQVHVICCEEPTKLTDGPLFLNNACDEIP